MPPPPPLPSTSASPNGYQKQKPPGQIQQRKPSATSSNTLPLGQPSPAQRSPSKHVSTGLAAPKEAEKRPLATSPSGSNTKKRPRTDPGPSTSGGTGSSLSNNRLPSNASSSSAAASATASTSAVPWLAPGSTKLTLSAMTRPHPSRTMSASATATAATLSSSNPTTSSSTDSKSAPLATKLVREIGQLVNLFSRNPDPSNSAALSKFKDDISSYQQRVSLSLLAYCNSMASDIFTEDQLSELTPSPSEVRKGKEKERAQELEIKMREEKMEKRFAEMEVRLAQAEKSNALASQQSQQLASLEKQLHSAQELQVIQHSQIQSLEQQLSAVNSLASPISPSRDPTSISGGGGGFDDPRGHNQKFNKPGSLEDDCWMTVGIYRRYRQSIYDDLPGIIRNVCAEFLAGEAAGNGKKRGREDSKGPSGSGELDDVKRRRTSVSEGGLEDGVLKSSDGIDQIQLSQMMKDLSERFADLQDQLGDQFESVKKDLEDAVWSKLGELQDIEAKVNRQLAAASSSSSKIDIPKLTSLVTQLFESEYAPKLSELTSDVAVLEVQSGALPQRVKDEVISGFEIKLAELQKTISEDVGEKIGQLEMSHGLLEVSQEKMRVEHGELAASIGGNMRALKERDGELEKQIVNALKSRPNASEGEAGLSAKLEAVKEKMTEVVDEKVSQLRKEINRDGIVAAVTGLRNGAVQALREFNDTFAKEVKKGTDGVWTQIRNEEAQKGQQLTKTLENFKMEMKKESTDNFSVLATKVVELDTFKSASSVELDTVKKAAHNLARRVQTIETKDAVAQRESSEMKRSFSDLKTKVMSYRDEQGKTKESVDFCLDVLKPFITPVAEASGSAV